MPAAVPFLRVAVSVLTSPSALKPKSRDAGAKASFPAAAPTGTSRTAASAKLRRDLGAGRRFGDMTVLLVAVIAAFYARPPMLVKRHSAVHGAGLFANTHALLFPHDARMARCDGPGQASTAIKLRRERQSLGFRWLSGVEAKGTQGGGQFASTPLSERLT